MSQEYKLKGLKSLDLEAGEKREVEVEGVEEGKVLLVNVGGKTTALGAKCTHYGAPMVCTETNLAGIGVDNDDRSKGYLQVMDG